jgi:hypothetical protein
VSATSLSRPRVLGGRYELRVLVGQGTFGRVYRGHDRRLGRAVAVKVIKPWWIEDPQWAARFEREAQLMARVSHPGIVQIFDTGRDRGQLYYVAELVEGDSLADRLAAGPLPAPQARELAEQLCRALAHAHAQRVVHRDVKPANVLIDRTGRVKVGDFGVARLAESATDAPAGTVVGTPRYMAPEQARGDPPTPATDVYGAGVVLYEMLAGRPPFTGGSAVELALRHLGEPPPPLPPATPPALARIVARALAKDPAERYPSAREMADALAAARAEGGATAPTLGRAPVPLGARRGPGRAPTLVGARPAPRRNFNPLERRRYVLLWTGALLLLGTMLAVALLAGSSTVRVPDLQRLSRAGAAAQARGRHLRVRFSSRYDASAPAGSVVTQRPAPGARVGVGATVRVVLSAGPRPVLVPQLVGERLTDAQAILARLGLGAAPRQVPAPGVTPGLVVGQWPGPSAGLLPHHRVSLSVAEVPRWRPLSSLSGDGAGQSAPLRIRGSRWRVVYSMAYGGVCGWFSLFCSPPSVQVQSASGGQTVAQFDLNQGSGQTQVLNSGPGVYQLRVTPGDSARWSLQVQDDY